MNVYNTIRTRLKAGLKEAKQRRQHRLERDLNSASPKDMRQAIQNLMGYKRRSSSIMWEAMLPDLLITFYAHFDLLSKESAVNSPVPLEDLPPCHMSLW